MGSLSPHLTRIKLFMLLPGVSLFRNGRHFAAGLGVFQGSVVGGFFHPRIIGARKISTCILLSNATVLIIVRPVSLLVQFKRPKPQFSNEPRVALSFNHFVSTSASLYWQVPYAILLGRSRRQHYGTPDGEARVL